MIISAVIFCIILPIAFKIIIDEANKPTYIRSDDEEIIGKKISNNY